MTERVECPVCNQELVHPVRVVVDKGGSTTTIDRQGVHDGNREAVSVGVVIETEYVCEQRHRFARVEEFRKGLTFTRTENRGVSENFPAVIWRE